MRDVMASEDTETIKKATEELTTALQGIGAAPYEELHRPQELQMIQVWTKRLHGYEQKPCEDVVDGEFNSVYAFD